MKQSSSAIGINKTVVCGEEGNDRTFIKMLEELHKLNLSGNMEVSEKLLLVTPVYVVARVTITYGNKRPYNKMVSYGVSRKGWADRPNVTTGISSAMSRARKAAVKKLRRKIPRVGGWYEA